MNVKDGTAQLVNPRSLLHLLLIAFGTLTVSLRKPREGDWNVQGRRWTSEIVRSEYQVAEGGQAAIRAGMSEC